MSWRYRDPRPVGYQQFQARNQHCSTLPLLLHSLAPPCRDCALDRALFYTWLFSIKEKKPFLLSAPADTHKHHHTRLLDRTLFFFLKRLHGSANGSASILIEELKSIYTRFRHWGHCIMEPHQAILLFRMRWRHLSAMSSVSAGIETSYPICGPIMYSRQSMRSNATRYFLIKNNIFRSFLY